MIVAERRSGRADTVIDTNTGEEYAVTLVYEYQDDGSVTMRWEGVETTINPKKPAPQPDDTLQRQRLASIGTKASP